MKRRTALVAAVLLLALAGRAGAGPITYVVSANASGSLNGGVFVNLPVQLTVTGDTNNVFQLRAGAVANLAATAELQIFDTNIGTVTALFTDRMLVYSEQSPIPSAGVADVTQNLNVVLAAENTGFTGYFLNTSTPIVTGLAFSNLGVPFNTTDGPLVLAGVTNDVAAFQAFAGVGETAVPEPTSLALLGAGVPVIAGYSWRRRRANR